MKLNVLVLLIDILLFGSAYAPKASARTYIKTATWAAVEAQQKSTFLLIMRLRV